MPINPQIPLMVETPPPIDILGTMGRAVTLRNAMTQQQEQARELASEDAIRKAMAEVGPDKTKRPEVLQRMYQIDGLAAEKLRAVWEQQDQREAQLEEMRARTDLIRLGKVKDAWAAVRGQLRQVIPQGATPEGWTAMRQGLAGVAKTFNATSGMDMTQLMGEVPETYDPGFYEQIKALPDWGDEVDKNLTEYEAWHQGFYRTHGRHPTDREITEHHKELMSTQRGAGYQKEELMVPDATGKLIRTPVVFDPNEGNYLDWRTKQPLPEGVQPVATGQQIPEQPAVVLDKPPHDEIANTVIPGGSYTYKAVYGGAETYVLTGELKTNPRSADPKQRANNDAVINTAYARIKNESTLPELRATYAALNQGQKAMMKQYLQTSAFVDSATKGINQLQSVSDSYPRSAIPVVNDIKLWWNRNLKQDPNLSELEVWVFNAARDYAKATSGSAGSVQQMTDAQIKASEMLFSLRQGPQAFERAAATMLQDMKNQVNAQRGKLNETRQGILNLMDETVGKPWLADDAPPSTTKTQGGQGSVKRLSPTTVEVVEGGTRSVLQFSPADADRFMAEHGPGAETTPGKPPTNPKVGDTWTSPTGLKRWDGTFWK